MTLGSLVELAADELEAWELRGDEGPAQLAARRARAGRGDRDRHRRRRRARVLRTRGKRHKRRAAARGAFDLAERTLRDAAREALRVFDDVADPCAGVIRSGA